MGRRIVNRRKRKTYMRYRGQEHHNALVQARLTPPVSEGLAYKVSVDTDTDHLVLFTNQPYAALMAAEAMADRMQARTHVMLGSQRVAEEVPKRRRRREGA
jgi:hypothetical protein